MAERLRLEDVQWEGQGKSLIWLEKSSGHGSLHQVIPHTDNQVLTDDFNVCSEVGYGGGEFSVSKQILIFAASDSRLYRKDLSSGKILPITPGWGDIASPAIHPSGNWVAYVFSDGVTDLIGIVDTHGLAWPRQLIRGADFYMQPVWHPLGKHIAWVEWNHPYLPWQASRIKIGEVSGMQLHLASEDWVAGDEKQPACQPQFSPDGKWLSYILADGEWDTLVVMKLRSGEKKTVVEGEKVLLSTPAWQQGMRSYGWSHDSQNIFYIQNYAGQATLWQTNIKQGWQKEIALSPYTWLSQLSVSPDNDALTCLASSPEIPKQVIMIKDNKIQIVTSSTSLDFPAGFLPKPKAVEWRSSEGEKVFGWYYPPENPDYICTGSPPLIVNVHSGPTSQRLLTFDLESAYFTSRGYAVLAVNYRGSSGYGHEYQDRLRHQWGLMDVQDVVEGAQAMASQGLADPKRMALMGSSAGGFTVLNTLIQFPGMFKAGICAYGVSDLIADAQQTHKLEKYYHRYLIGDLEQDHDVFIQRSPIYHADCIVDPVAFFHGAEDKVVMPAQTEQMVEELKRRGVPCLYRKYNGEGHGFRKNETIKDFYQQIDKFLGSI